MLSVLLKAHAARTNPTLADIIWFWEVCSIDYATCKSPRDFQHDSIINLQQTVHFGTCSLSVQMMAILHWHSLYKGPHGPYNTDRYYHNTTYPLSLRSLCLRAQYMSHNTVSQIYRLQHNPDTTNKTTCYAQNGWEINIIRNDKFVVVPSYHESHNIVNIHQSFIISKSLFYGG